LQKEAYVHAIPDVSIYRFTRDLEEEGIDPVMPVIRDDGERIVLDGIGLFKDDRYAGKVNVDEANIFMLMYENFRRGKLFVQVDEQERLMMDSVINRRKVTVRRTREGCEVRLRLKVRGAIMEYEGPAELVNGTHLRQLEQRVAQNIAQRCETVIRQMQEFGSDALGIGRFVRNSGTYAQWKKLNWREEFPKVDIRCEVRVQFNNIGKYSKSG
jgi:spore germination protein